MMRVLVLISFLGLGTGLSAAEPMLSFRNDIMPVLTKAGCNLGSCHGAQTGKGRLAISLRGEDPVKDHGKLVKTFLKAGDPGRSLMLRKATLEIPHKGGERFTTNSESYRLLARWIVEGAKLADEEPRIVRLEAEPKTKVLFAPVTNISIGVTAHFSDGTRRDVNRWAIFEPSTLDVEVADGEVTSLRPGETTVNVRYLGRQASVRLAFVPERPGFVWRNPPTNNFIDAALRNKWKTLRIRPSDLCDDATFVRRAHLDLTGAIPKGSEAKAFVADASGDKRGKLIDALLRRPEFADFWTLKWADLLRVEEIVLDRRGVEMFHGWIRESIAANKPLDRFVREILTAMGSTYQVAPANYYRALRQPDLRAEAVAQVFLGTRLNCAKCHNHPFEHWTMDDYYGFAAVFDGIDYDIKENKRYDDADKKNYIGEQIVKLGDKRELKHPRNGALPELRLLGGDSLKMDNQRLKKLGEWLSMHPLFARVQVNRVWSQLMGRGLVDPVDDFRATNPAVNPELLDALAEDFAKNGFDLRHAIRTICASRAYQLSSRPNRFNADDTLNFARVVPRRLEAEQLLDSVHLALGGLPRFEGYKDPMRAVAIPGIRATYRPRKPTNEDKFLHLFGKPERQTDSDTERINETTLAQAFELTSGGTLNRLLMKPDNTLAAMLRLRDGDLVNELHWTFLSRAPGAVEYESALRYLDQASDRRLAVEDLAWALLNAKEFLLRK